MYYETHTITFILFMFSVVFISFYCMFIFLIFTMTPGAFPHAWFENFSAMPAVWVPFSLSGNREGAAAFGDAYIIASTYRGSFSESARYGISIVADMYRRFTWIGLPVAAVCYGVFYGCYWRIVFWVYERKSKFYYKRFKLKILHDCRGQ